MSSASDSSSHTEEPEGAAEAPPAPPRKVIDAHAHIAHEDFIPRSFVDGSIDNLLVAMQARGVPLPRAKVSRMYEKKMQDPLCDTLVAEMNEAGIATSILLAADFTYILKDSTAAAFETALWSALRGETTLAPAIAGGDP